MPTELEDSFERALAGELLASERRRLTVIAALAAVVVAYTLGLVLLAPPVLARPGSPLSQGAAEAVLPGMFVGLLVYAMVVRSRVARSIETNRPPPPGYAYLGVTAEVSFVSIVMFVLGLQADPVRVLVSPLLGLYAAFIAVTALQMHPRASLWAAGLAVGQYAAYFAWVRSTVDAADYPAWVIAPTPVVGRCVALALVGGATAFVASQFRVRALNVLRANEERNQVAATFGRHVSPQVVDRLIEQGGRPISELRHVCVMFLDIRDFTTLSEGRPPDELVSLLNELFSFMIDAINRNEGFINKFLGDGFMAVFGAPLSGGPDATHAVKASREMLEELVRYNERTGRGIGIGIGLHAGEALTGSVGSAERTEYTVMGDVVNVAARIESLNKRFSAQLLVSRDVYETLGEADREGAEDLGQVEVKGRGEAVHVYRLE